MIVFVRSRTAFGKYVSFRDLPGLRSLHASFAWIGPDTVVADLGHPAREDLPPLLFGGAPLPGWLDFIEVLEIGADAAAAPPFIDDDVAGEDGDDGDDDDDHHDDDDDDHGHHGDDMGASGDDRAIIADAHGGDHHHHGETEEDEFEPDWRSEYDDWSDRPSRYVADRPGTSIIANLSPMGAPERPSFGRKLLAVCFEKEAGDYAISVTRRRLDGWLKGKRPAAVWHGRRIVALCFLDERPSQIVLDALKPILESEEVFDYFIVQPAAMAMAAEVSPLAAWLDAGWRAAAPSPQSRPRPPQRGGIVEVSRIKRRTAAKRPAEAPPAEPATPAPASVSRRPLGLRRLSPQELRERELRPRHAGKSAPSDRR